MPVKMIQNLNFFGGKGKCQNMATAKSTIVPEINLYVTKSAGEKKSLATFITTKLNPHKVQSKINSLYIFPSVGIFISKKCFHSNRIAMVHYDILSRIE